MPRSMYSHVVVLVLVVASWIVQSQIASAQWVVLHDKNKSVARDMPQEAMQKLQELARQGVTLKSISFTPQSGWAILYDKSGFSTRNIPQAAFESLQKLAKQGATLKSITFSPGGGWVILYDKQGIDAAKVSDEALSKLRELAEGGSELTSIAFTTGGGWVILIGKNGLFARKIPDDAFKKLNELAKQGAQLKSVSFTPEGGWTILHDKSGVAFDKVPDELRKDLVELSRDGAALQGVSFLGRPYLQLSRDDAETRQKILARLAANKVPGVSIALIEDGQLKWARGFGVVQQGKAKPLTDKTRFQAASISKPVAALGALVLAQKQKLELDQDVNLQLQSWKVPANELTQQKHPTVREILSHSAGFNVHGFPGYATDAAVPSLLQVLDGTQPANTRAIRVVVLPGTKMQYSGGGYCVLQKLLIDVTKASFPKLMQEHVLGPLGMNRSSYAQPLLREWESEAAVAHDNAGNPLAGKWHVYPEMAPAGLWTTPSDLALFVLALSRAQQHESGAILNPALADAMFTQQIGGFGLGIGLRGKGRSLTFSHSGSNAGFRCLFVGYPATGQGAVLMSNSDNGDRVISEFLEDLRIEYQWPG